MGLQQLISIAAGALVCGAAGCSDSATIIYRSQATGELSVALGVGAGEDVVSVRIDVVAAADACDGVRIATQTIALVDTGLDARFILPAGEVRVCAAPLAAEGPSQACAVAFALATITAGESTDVDLVSQCAGDDTGALHASVGFNGAPSITSLELTPGEEISVCESTAIAIAAADPEGDALEVLWTADGGRLRAEGQSAIFSAAARGDYMVTVAIADAHGGRTSLKVPVHVSAAVCNAAAEVHQIFLARCSPCHTTGTSGGLKLDPADIAFNDLVGQPARSAACAARPRVMPGDSAASYLIAKLRGEAGICGVQMPRGQPPLPEAEILTIAAWIDSLPH
jgi:hypothetical protein